MPSRSRLRIPRVRPAPMLGLTFALVVAVQVCVAPILGLSDNGDFDRVTHPLGLVLPPYSERNGFISPTLPYGPKTPSGYWSSLFPLLHLLVDLPRRLGAAAFDLRLLGAFYAVLGGLAVWLLVRALPGHRVQVAVGVLLVLLLGDTAFVGYLGSYYSEPSVLIGALLVLAAVLAVRGRRRVPSVLVVLAAVAVGVLVLAKAQNVVLLLVLIPALLLLRPRLLAAACCLGLVVAGNLFLQQQPPELKSYYVYDTIFVSILPHSPNPAADLRELKLDPRLLRFSGNSVYHYSDLDNPSFQRLLASGGRTRLYAFYLHHPGRAVGLAVRATRDTAELRPSYLGNRAASDAYPRTTMACELCLYSGASRTLKPVAPELLPALYLLAVVALWRLRRAARRAEDDDVDGADESSRLPTLADAIGVTTLLALLSFATAIAGEGDFELVKHLYPFELLTGVLGCLLAGAAVLLWERRSRVPLAPPDFDVVSSAARAQAHGLGEPVGT